MSKRTANPEPSRDVEKLVALLRYEMSGVGVGRCEILEDLLKRAHDVVLVDDFPDSPTTAYLDRLDRDCVTIAEYLVRGLIAIGRIAEAEDFVEGCATSRRECDAKFGTPREIPFGSEEREALAKRWGTGSLESTETH